MLRGCAPPSTRTPRSESAGVAALYGLGYGVAREPRATLRLDGPLALDAARPLVATASPWRPAAGEGARWGPRSSGDRVRSGVRTAGELLLTAGVLLLLL